MIEIFFTLMGEMPSKKNRWSRGKNGQVFIPKSVQTDLDDFLWQIKSIKNEQEISCITGKIQLEAIFFMKRDADLDNVTTTLMDLLQKGNIIKNDKNITDIRAIKSKTYGSRHGSRPRVNVRLSTSEDEL